MPTSTAPDVPSYAVHKSTHAYRYHRRWPGRTLFRLPDATPGPAPSDRGHRAESARADLGLRRGVLAPGAGLSAPRRSGHVGAVAGSHGVMAGPADRARRRTGAD